MSEHNYSQPVTPQQTSSKTACCSSTDCHPVIALPKAQANECCSPKTESDSPTASISAAAPLANARSVRYRIDNMDDMVKQLRDAGVAIFKGPESHENGKFLWLLDPDGNKVELWEPKLWDSKNKEA